MDGGVMPPQPGDTWSFYAFCWDLSGMSLPLMLLLSFESLSYATKRLLCSVCLPRSLSFQYWYRDVAVVLGFA